MCPIVLIVGLFLPPYDQCPKQFLGQVLTGKKKVLYRREVPRLSAPKWPELGMNEIWPKIKDDRVLQQYFPDPT